MTAEEFINSTACRQQRRKKYSVSRQHFILKYYTQLKLKL